MAKWNPGVHLATHVIKHHDPISPFSEREESQAARKARMKKETIAAAIVGFGITALFVGTVVAMILIFEV